MEEGRRSAGIPEDQLQADSSDASLPAIGSPVPVPNVLAAAEILYSHANRPSGGDSSDRVSFFDMSASSSSSAEMTPRQKNCQELLRKGARIHMDPRNHEPTNYPIHGLDRLESPRDPDMSKSSSLDMSSPDNSQNLSSINERSAIPELTTPQKPASISRKSEEASPRIVVTSPRISAVSDIRLSSISAPRDSADYSHRPSSSLELNTPRMSRASRKSVDTTDTSVAMMNSADKSNNRRSQDSDIQIASPANLSKNYRGSVPLGLATPQEKEMSGRESADNSMDIRLNSPRPSGNTSVHNVSISSVNDAEDNPQNRALSPMHGPATPLNKEPSSRKSTPAADASINCGVSLPGSSVKRTSRTSSLSSFRDSELPPENRGHSPVLQLGTPRSNKSSRRSADTTGARIGVDINSPESSEERESHISNTSTPDLTEQVSHLSGITTPGLAEPSQNRGSGLTHGNVSALESSRKSIGVPRASLGNGLNSPRNSMSQIPPISSFRTPTNPADSQDRRHSSVHPATSNRPELSTRNLEHPGGRVSGHINVQPPRSVGISTPSLRGFFTTPQSYRPRTDADRADILLPNNQLNSPVLRDLFTTPGTSRPRENIHFPDSVQGGRKSGRSTAEFDQVGGHSVPSATSFQNGTSGHGRPSISTSSQNRTPGQGRASSATGSQSRTPRQGRPSTAQPNGSNNLTEIHDMASRAKSLDLSFSLSSIFRTPHRGEKNALSNRESLAENPGVTQNNSLKKARRFTSASRLLEESSQPLGPSDHFNRSSRSESAELQDGALSQITPKSAGRDNDLTPSRHDLPPTRGDSSSPESSEQQEEDASSPEEADVSADEEEELQDVSLISKDEEIFFTALDTLPPPPVWFCSVSFLVYLIQRRLNKEAAHVSFERFMEIVFRSAAQVTTPTDMETEENERCLNKGRGYTAADMYTLCKRFLHKSNNPFEYYQLLRTMCPFPPLLERLVPVDRGGRISALQGIYSGITNQNGQEQ